MVGSEFDGNHVGCNEVEMVFGYFFKDRRHGQRDADVGSEKNQMADSWLENSRAPADVLPEGGIPWDDRIAAFQGLQPAL